MKNSRRFSKISAVAAAVALTVTGMSILPEKTIETNAASLTGQNATAITSQMTVGWNLGNTLESVNDNLKSTASPAKFATAWGNPEPTQELFNTVKNAGFNTVRIPTTWYQHLEYDDASQMYVVNQDWMDYVKQTVDYAYNQGMFVILNVHHEDWVNASVFTDETYAVAAKKLGDIWTQVSDEFADYDQHLIFEGMNEPRQTGNSAVPEWGNGGDDGGYTWNYINNLNAVFVDSVRNQGSSANKERLLMLPGYCASSDFNAIRAIKIPDNAGNVALSVHGYLPYFFTMDNSQYASHEFPGKSGYGEDYETSLSNFFTGLKQISDEKNAPVIIGEFSASNFNNTEARCNWATSYLTKAKAAGFPCVLWDNNAITNPDAPGEAHGYLYRLTNTWYEDSAPVVKAMMDVYNVSSNLPAYEEYVAPPFSWDDVKIGADWKEVYKAENGLELEAWKPEAVSGWKQYANEDYDFVMVYTPADADPALVLQNSAKETWSYISPSDTDTKYLARFTYQDLLDGIADSGVKLEEEDNLFVSARMLDVNVYGLYAVPKNSTPEPSTEEKPTETIPPASLKGDANFDGEVTLVDLVQLQKWLHTGYSFDGATIDLTMDMNDDGLVNIYDLILLKKQLLK